MTTPSYTQVEHREKGFTLIEMLIVLALLGVAFTLGLPLVQGVPDKLCLETTMRRLQGALQTTRSTAISTNSERVLSIDTASGTISSTAQIAIQSLGAIHVDLFMADIERRSPTTGGFRFFPDGGSTGGTIALRLNHLRGHVYINWLTGYITASEDKDAR